MLKDDSLLNKLRNHSKYNKLVELLEKGDLAHNFDHVLRVYRLVLQIGKEENADLEILEAAALLHDIARGLEVKGEVEDHAFAGAKIAREILNQIDFPKQKIDAVCHAIIVHPKSNDSQPETLEAQILQDADFLDALGAIYIARVIAFGIQSKKYRRPLFVDEEIDNINEENKNKSTIHYLLYRLQSPRLQAETCNTETARKLAKNRLESMKSYTKGFVKEWRGEY